MRGLAVAAVVLGAVGTACVVMPPTKLVSAQAQPNTAEFYTHNVRPIFDANCMRCHGGMNHRGGLSLETRASMLKGGHDGAVIVPGDAANSLLVKLIRHEGPKDDPMPMPPKSKISDADIATVTAWINAGAVMPEPGQ
jgi:mono/diheme cytochrome c family protein